MSTEFTSDANIALLWNLISEELQLGTRDTVYVSNVRQTFEKNLDFYLRSMPIGASAGLLGDQNKRFMVQLVRALKQLEIIPAKSLRQAQVGEEVPLPFVSSNERDRSVFDQQLLQRQREFDQMMQPERPPAIDFQYPMGNGKGNHNHKQEVNMNANANAPAHFHNNASFQHPSGNGEMEELTVEQLLEQRKRQDASLFSHPPPPIASTTESSMSTSPSIPFSHSVETNRQSTRKVEFADEESELAGRAYDVPPSSSSSVSSNTEYKDIRHAVAPSGRMHSDMDGNSSVSSDDTDDSFFLKLKPLPASSAMASHARTGAIDPQQLADLFQKWSAFSEAMNTFLNSQRQMP